MGVTVERLLAVLEARIDKYEKNLAKAAGTTERQFSRIERRGKQLESRMASIGAAASRAFAGSFAGAAALRGAQALVDAATRIENALKVAGLAGEDLTRVYDRLFSSAQRNAAPIENLVELYSRAALVQNELGVSSEELLEFTDKVAVALRVSGKSASEASGALLQLSQALGSGVVRAEEFNSILEGALPVAQAAAAGLEEAGGSVAKLRQLVVDGKVSSEAFFRAFEAGAVILEEKLASAELTVSQGFVRLQNVLIRTAGRLNEASGASGEAGKALDRLASFVESLGNVLVAVQGPLSSASKLINQLADAADRLTGIDLSGTLGLFLNPVGSAAGTIEKLTAELEDAIRRGALTEQAIQEYAARNNIGQTTKTTTKTGRVPASGSGVNTVSIKDFAVTEKAKKGRKPKANEFERELQQLRERTALIEAMTAAQAGLNPLMDNYYQQLERVRIEQELLAAAERAGVEVTPALKAKIADLADQYAVAAEQADRLAEKQENARAAAEEMQALGQEVLGGFISDLRNGVSATDALANALNRVLDRLIEIGLQNLFSGGGGGGFAGIFGGKIIPGILHRGGVAGRDGYGHGRAVSPAVFAGAQRYHGGGVAGLRPGEVPAILQRGEVVIPRGAAMAGNGSNVSVTVNNAPPGTRAREERGRGPDGRELRKVVIDIMDSHVTGGGFDKPINGRFGIAPRTVRRG